MANSIDERIVEMQFNNGQFEKGIQESMQSLEALKEALELDKSAKSLAALEKAAGNVSFDKLADNVDHISKRFTLLGEIGMQAMERIATKAVDAGEKMLKAMTIDMPSKGWSKYNEDVQSTQTIINATGEDIAVVNEQLEKLMWFTDETSYNYSDMTNNIGKFTAAGRDLDESVTAMMGISLWAARSGQHAQEAGRAMYNLSQALGAGYVGVTDWRSIELANMATEEFKQTAIDTAIELGKISKSSDITSQNFRQTLKEKWFDNDVLLATLAKYGNYTEKVYQEYLNSGKEATASDIISYLEDAGMELGRAALIAGQEAITFSQAIEATQDAVSSKWLTMFKLVFGNYEQAKELWTLLANDLYDMFAWPIQVFNNTLEEGWVNTGGRQAMIQGLVDVLHSLFSIVAQLKEIFWETFGPILVSGLNAASVAMSQFGAALSTVAYYVFGIEPVVLENQGVPEATEELETYAETLEALDRMLKYGATGEDVKKLQERLIELGYAEDLGPMLADGIYGPRTQKAVKHFQKDFGIAVDGIYGPISHMTIGKALGLVDAVKNTKKLAEYNKENVGAQSLFTAAAEEALGLSNPTLKFAKNVRAGANSLLTAADAAIELGTDTSDAFKDENTIVTYFKNIIKGATAFVDMFKNGLKLIGQVALEIGKVLLIPIGAVLTIINGIAVCVTDLAKKINWQDLTAKGLEKIRNLLTPISDKFHEITDRVRAFFEEGDEVSTFTDLWNKLKTTFENTDVGGKVVEGFKELQKTQFWQRGVQFVTKIQNGIKGLPQKVKKTTSAFKRWWESGVLPRDMDDRFRKPLTNLWLTIIRFRKEFMDAWNAEGISGVFKLLGNKIAGFATDVISKLKGSKLGQYFQTLFGWFKDSSLYKGISSTWDKVKEFFSGISGSDLVQSAQGTLGKLSAFATELKNKIQELIGASDGLTNVQTVWSSVSSWFKDFGSLIQTAFDDFFLGKELAPAGSQSLLTAVGESFEGTPDGYGKGEASAFAPLMNWLESQFNDFITWIGQFCTSAGEQISSAIDALLESLGIADEVETALGFFKTQWFSVTTFLSDVSTSEEATTIRENLENSWGKVAGWFSDFSGILQECLDKFFHGGPDLKANNGQSLLTAVSDSFEGTPNVQGSTSAFAGLSFWIERQWNTFVEWLVSFCEGIGTRIYEAFQGVLDNLGIADQVNQAVETLRSSWDSLAEFFSETAGSDEVQNAKGLNKVPAFIEQAFSSIAEKLGIAETAQSVIGILSQIWTDILAFINSVKENGIDSAVQEAWDNATGFISQVFGDLNGLLSGELGGLLGEVSGESSEYVIPSKREGAQMSFVDQILSVLFPETSAGAETIDRVAQEATKSSTAVVDTASKALDEVSTNEKSLGDRVGEFVDSSGIAGLPQKIATFATEHTGVLVGLSETFAIFEGGRLLGNLSTTVKSLSGKYRPLHAKILALSASFALIAASLYTLGHVMKPEEIDVALDTIDRLFKRLAALAAALFVGNGLEKGGEIGLSWLKKKMDLEDTDSSGEFSNLFGRFAESIQQLGVGLLTLVATIGIISVIPDDVLERGCKKLLQVFAAMSPLLLALFAGSAGVSWLSSKNFGKGAFKANPTAGLKTLEGLAKVIESIVPLLVACAGIAAAFGVIDKMDIFKGSEEDGVISKGIGYLDTLMGVVTKWFAADGFIALAIGLAGTLEGGLKGENGKLKFGGSGVTKTMTRVIGLIVAVTGAVTTFGVLAAVLGTVDRLFQGNSDEGPVMHGIKMIEEIALGLTLVIGAFEGLAAISTKLNPWALFKFMVAFGAGLAVALVALGAGVGLAGKFASGGLDDLRAVVVRMGYAVKSFSTSVQDFDKAKSDDALAFLGEFAKVAFKSAGKSILGGKNQGESLASDIRAIGVMLWSFGNNVPDDITTKWTTVKGMLTELPGMMELLSGSAGMVDTCTTVLGGISGAVKLYYDNLNGVEIDSDDEVDVSVVNRMFQDIHDNWPKQDLVGEVASYVTEGGDSLISFAGGMESVATGVSAYAKALKDITTEDVTKATDTVGFLYALNLGLEDSSNLSGFGDNITLLAGALRDYGTALSADDISIDKVNEANKIVDKLVEVNKSLPETGGIKQFVDGIKDLNKFSDGISNLGYGIAAYALNIGNQTFGQNVIDSLPVIVALAEAQSKLQRTGGFEGFLFGNANMESFGKNMGYLGEGIKNYANEIGTYKFGENVLQSAKIIEALSLAQAHLSQTGGVSTLLSDIIDGIDILHNAEGMTDEKLDRFMNMIYGLGLFAEFAYQRSRTNHGTLEMVNDIIEANNTLNEAGFEESNMLKCIKWLAELGNQVDNLARLGKGKTEDILGNLGSGLNEMMTQIVTGYDGTEGSEIIGSLATISSAVSSFAADESGAMSGAGASLTKNIETGMNSASIGTRGLSDKLRVVNDTIRGYHKNFKADGKYLMQGFADGISENDYLPINALNAVIESLKRDPRIKLEIDSPSKLFASYGSYLMQGLSNGIAGDSGLATNSMNSAVSAIMNTAEGSLGSLASIINGDFNADPVVRPVVNMDNVRASAAAMNNMLSGSRSIQLGASIGRANAASNAMARRNAAIQNGSRTENVTNNNSNDVNITGDFYIRDEMDIRSLANEIAALTQDQRRALGLGLA